MKVLHIACGFSYSSVYKNLFKEFSNSKLNIEVYVPQHDNKSTPKIINEDYPYRLYSNKLIKSFDKILYFSKIWRMTKDVEENFDLANVSILHAHSLFSDGGVAYELYKEYKIPYIVAIRNTDVNKYYKYAIHLRKYALNILLNAHKIIFISPSYRNIVLSKYIPTTLKKSIEQKIEIIPNGVDRYWLEAPLSEQNNNSNYIKLLFIGRIDHNKNLKNVVTATKILISKGFKCSLDVIGDGPLRKKLENEVAGNAHFHFHGAINDKDTIKKIYLESHILVVPSFNETFGLVYVESLSCGRPIIYTRGQGFDGFFENGEIGFSVDPNNPDELAEHILQIKKNYSDMSSRCYNAAKKFNWMMISQNYKRIYNSSF